MERRTVSSQFQTREDGEDLRIEGYFAVFNEKYELFDGATETIAEGAFDGQTSADVRALINHDTTLVIGRTKAGTLELKQDSRGLWGSVKINPNDSDAMNIYARVKRGDVDQCSFGFNITDEETEIREDGSVLWTINAVELFEVSVCTFPAYEATSVSARHKDFEEIKERKNDAWKSQMHAKLKGAN